MPFEMLPTKDTCDVGSITIGSCSAEENGRHKAVPITEAVKASIDAVERILVAMFNDS